MGIRSKRRKQQAAAVTDSAASGLGGRAGERLTVFVLTLIAGFLGYVYFGFLPAQERGRQVVFDYENPMLRAQPGDCVRAQPSDQPGKEMCLVVRQRVERPARGPASLPGHTDVRLMLPYLALDMHEERGQGEGCSGTNAMVTLRALNNFGLDPESQVLVERIVPVWAKWSGGKEGVLYEVTLNRYDTEGKYVSFCSPEMPVTGLVKMEAVSTRGDPQRMFFHEIDCQR